MKLHVSGEQFPGVGLDAQHCSPDKYNHQHFQDGH